MGPDFFDCPAAIGYQSMHAVFAADMLYVPSGLGYWENDSTTAFVGHLSEALEDLSYGFEGTSSADKVTLPKVFSGMRGVLDELDVLRRHIGEAPTQPDGDPNEPTAVSVAKRGSADPTKTKTTFDIRTSAGQVKCTAAVGRLEIKVDQDFSAIDRARLERTITGLVDGLG